MTPLSELLVRLEGLAKDATPGTWELRDCNVMVPTKRFAESQANREYVHACSPENILTLITAVRNERTKALEEALDVVREVCGDPERRADVRDAFRTSIFKIRALIPAPKGEE